jgi:hypothetical protein
VPILLFFVFVAAVVFFLLGLGYGLSSLVEEERSSTRRCRIPQEAHYRGKTRRRRCKGGSGCVF